MGINIVVCVKRTPSSTSVALDSKTGQVKTDDLPHGINPLDEYAVEEALRIRDKVPDSKIIVLSAGTPKAEEAVRAALALGCNEGVLVTDEAFQWTDTLGTSYILAQAVKKIAEEKGGAHLLLFGKETNDGASGQMPSETAAWLDWPSAIFVRKIPDVSAESVSVERLMEDGVDSLKLKLPAVVSVTKEINEPRLPSLRGKMAAKKAPMDKWSAADIQADASKLGKDNSPTVVVGMSPIPPRPAGAVIPGEEPEEKAKNLVEKLKEAKLI